MSSTNPTRLGVWTAHLATTLAVLFMLVGSNTATAASVSDQGGPGGSLSTTTVRTGGTVTVTVTGLMPYSTNSVEFGGFGPYGPVYNASRYVIADENGTATWTERIIWAPGQYDTLAWMNGSLFGVNTGNLTVR